MFETRGRSSPRRWPLWKGCELCGHNLKLHDEKGRCPVCRENARRSRRRGAGAGGGIEGGWSPCYEVVPVELPPLLMVFLAVVANKFWVSIEELALIVLEVDYYCERVLGLPAVETLAVLREAVREFGGGRGRGGGRGGGRGRGGGTPGVKMVREVTGEERRRIAEALALLFERDGFLGEIVRKHRIPAPNYITLFYRSLIFKAHYLPGVAEALERRVESLDQD